MRTIILVIIGVIVVSAGAILWSRYDKETTDTVSTEEVNTFMKLESNVFENNEIIPAKYTCDGDNIIPPLSISDVPNEAKSLVLIIDDPDVPKSVREDGIFNHWLVWNIPPTTSEIKESETPSGVEGKNTSGSIGYTGPCPPDREHRYFFRLYALDSELEVDPEAATKADLEAAMSEHIVEQTEFMGRYDRPR